MQSWLMKSKAKINTQSTEVYITGRDCNEIYREGIVMKYMLVGSHALMIDEEEARLYKIKTQGQALLLCSEYSTWSDVQKGFLDVNLLQHCLGDSVEQLHSGTPPEAHPHTWPRGNHPPHCSPWVSVHLEMTLWGKWGILICRCTVLYVPNRNGILDIMIMRIQEFKVHCTEFRVNT